MTRRETDGGTEPGTEPRFAGDEPEAPPAPEPPPPTWRDRARAYATASRPTSAWLTQIAAIGLDGGPYDDEDPFLHEDCGVHLLPRKGLGEPLDDVLDALGPAFDALEAAMKHRTVHAILGELCRRDRSPALRFVRALDELARLESPLREAEQLSRELPMLPEVWGLLARSQDDPRARAATRLREAEAHLAGGPHPLGDWLRARADAMGWDCHAARAFEEAARGFAAAGELEAALSAVERGLAVAPEASGLHESRALTLAAMGRHAESQQAYTRALGCEGDEARQALLHFGRGGEAARLGRLDEACADLARAVALDPAWGPRALLDEAYMTLLPSPALLTAAGVGAVPAAEPVADTLGSEVAAALDEATAAADAGRWAEAMARLEEGVEALGEQRSQGLRPASALVERATALVLRALAARVEGLVPRALPLRARLLEIEEPDAARRAERAWWGALRAAAREEVRAGRAPEELALAVLPSLVGEAPGALAAHPAFAELPAVLGRAHLGHAERLAATYAMGDVRDADSLDLALAKLQALALRDGQPPRR